MFDLCCFVLNTAIESDQVAKVLVRSCLDTFASFMSWIPYGYIFETDICDKLLQHFFIKPSYRNDSLKCLLEIVTLQIDESEEKSAEYNEKLFLLFMNFVQKLQEVTNNVDLANEAKIVPQR